MEAKGEINTAVPILQKAATLDPEDQAIQQVIFMRFFLLTLSIVNLLFPLTVIIKMHHEATARRPQWKGFVSENDGPREENRGEK